MIRWTPCIAPAPALSTAVAPSPAAPLYRATTREI